MNGSSVSTNMMNRFFLCLERSWSDPCLKFLAVLGAKSSPTEINGKSPIGFDLGRIWPLLYTLHILQENLSICGHLLFYCFKYIVHSFSDFKCTFVYKEKLCIDTGDGYSTQRH